MGSAHPTRLTAKESPSARYFSFHAPPSRSQIQASPRQLAIAGHTEFLDESGFGGWVMKNRFFVALRMTKRLDSCLRRND